MSFSGADFGNLGEEVSEKSANFADNSSAGRSVAGAVPFREAREESPGNKEHHIS